MRTHPDWSFDQIRTAIEHRFNSECENPAAPAENWLRRLEQFRDGPLNRFRKPAAPNVCARTLRNRATMQRWADEYLGKAGEQQHEEAATETASPLLAEAERLNGIFQTMAREGTEHDGIVTIDRSQVEALRPQADAIQERLIEMGCSEDELDILYQR